MTTSGTKQIVREMRAMKLQKIHRRLAGYEKMQFNGNVQMRRRGDEASRPAELHACIYHEALCTPCISPASALSLNWYCRIKVYISQPDWCLQEST